MKKIISGLVVLACLMMSNNAQATTGDLINIKMNTLAFSLTGVATGAQKAGGGYVWNAGYTGGVNGLGGTKANLVTSDNRATTVGFAYTSDNYAAIGSAFSGFGPTGAPYYNLMRSYFSTIDQHTLTFSGLDANASFNLTVYSQAENNAIPTSLKVSLQGAPGPFGSASLAATTPASGVFVNGKNYITITGVSDATGQLKLNYEPLVINGTNKAVINALQLFQSSPTNAPIPEPSTMVLLGIGGLLSARRVKKLSLNTQKIGA
jgi:hypothetical protein